MTHILAVDDDPEALGSIRRVLEDEGYTVSLAQSAQEAFEILKHQVPDLIIADIIMPEINGVDMVRRIRANPYFARLPVIFLTAKSRPRDIAVGLDAGADDYLTKPFEVVELPARVRALLRRTQGGMLDTDADWVVQGDLRLHTTNPVAHVQEEAVDLTPLEHRILHYLLMNAGRPVSTERLLVDVWEYYPGTGDPSTVYAHMSNLRRKIGEDIIHSIRGKGYLLSL